MKRAIILGGSGFIGKAVLEKLKRENIEILAVTHKRPIAEDEKVRVIGGGINSLTSQSIDHFSPDVIFHCARPTFPYFKRRGRQLAAIQSSFLNKKLIRHISVSGSRPRLLFLSGSLMYGRGEQPHGEDSPLHPVSYARQYARGEKPILKAIGKENMTVQVIRLPWIIGRGSWFQWFYLDAIQKYQAIPFFGDQSNRMEIIDIEDAAKFIVQVARNQTSSAVINLPAKEAITQKEFVSMVSRIMNVPAVDFRQLYGHKLEKETVEAFQSTILLKTRHTELTDDLDYTPIDATLQRIGKPGLGD
ncbi:MAG: NAD(P)-dependent oxidoreductase [bacterium]